MTRQRRRRGPPPIVYLLIVLLLVGVGYWYFTLPKPLPPGTYVRIDGSTSMVTIDENLKSDFEKKYRGTTVDIKTNGTEKGIEALKAGSIDIAAASRRLTQQEKNLGLVELPIAPNEIAVVVGKDNPFRQGLTSVQLADIFKGKIDNWSTLGGSPATIRVMNRSPASGTHQVFKELVLKGENFGTTPNITTWQRDETTGYFRVLKKDGIGYATADQAFNQETVRVVPIDNVKPGQVNYPLRRMLYYVYKAPPSPVVKAFVEYAQRSPG